MMAYRIEVFEFIIRLKRKEYSVTIFNVHKLYSRISITWNIQADSLFYDQVLDCLRHKENNILLTCLHVGFTEAIDFWRKYFCNA